jgi:purine-nucleoside phosphorylase
VSPPAETGPNISEAADRVRSLTGIRPHIGLILGSGLGTALEGHVKEDISIPYPDIPGFWSTTVPGHEGRLSLGRLSGKEVAAFHGRFHLYEGKGMEASERIVLLCAELGVSTLIVTGAAGALVPEVSAGTVIVLRDHLNMMGDTPLRAWRSPDGTPAFVNMAGAYEPGLRRLALEGAAAQGIRATEGIYVGVAGPAYETPAEVAFLRSTGATVVGMSIVPEVIAARAVGMSVLGLCSVTNELGAPVSHEEVMRVSSLTATSVGRLLVDLLPRIEEGARDA